MTTPEYADDLDDDLFRAANGLERLFEMTGDRALREAARVVGAQRSTVRKHMTETMRQRAPN